MTKLGFQLYSARNFPPLGDVFALIASAGYAEVEGYGALYSTLDDTGFAAMREALASNGLTMPTGHFSLDMLENEPDRVLGIARALEMDAVYCPYLLPELRPTDAKGWVAFGKRLQTAGAPLRAAGLDYGWHNHDFEFFALDDGSVPLERIFEGGPDLSWEADLAWAVRGGADPFAWIGKDGHRITSVHVKDIAKGGVEAGEDGWADVGHGIMPWRELLAALRKTPVRHFVVEHDNPSDLTRLATRSAASFQSY